ncbi:hypothetical protein PR048_024846 [Dryococelus australis]|uniref:Uncharacterized protein n=1 Tax=Dryococelus australis TaxID=614101 RepID=A0ABQ9GPN1_9NEOP|nr:hypothetical protein PR048_024846 [Dryococelus australis]
MRVPIAATGFPEYRSCVMECSVRPSNEGMLTSGNPENPTITKSAKTVWHCSSESIVYIENSITPLNCQRVKEYVTLMSEDCEASRSAWWQGEEGEGGAILKNNKSPAYTLQKAKSKYRNLIRLKKASRKQSSYTYETPYDLVKRCRELKNINASERVTYSRKTNGTCYWYNVLFITVAVFAMDVPHPFICRSFRCNLQTSLMNFLRSTQTTNCPIPKLTKFPVILHASPAASSPSAGAVLFLFAFVPPLSLHLLRRTFALPRRIHHHPPLRRAFCFQPRFNTPFASYEYLKFPPDKYFKLNASLGVPFENRVWSSAEMKERGKREIPEKTCQPTASSGTIPTCKNPDQIALVVCEQANCSATVAPWSLVFISFGWLRALASLHGDPFSIPSGFTYKFSHGRIVPDDAACRGWVSSGCYLIPRPCNPSRFILGSRFMSQLETPSTGGCRLALVALAESCFLYRRRRTGWSLEKAQRNKTMSLFYERDLVRATSQRALILAERSRVGDGRLHLILPFQAKSCWVREHTVGENTIVLSSSYLTSLRKLVTPRSKCARRGGSYLLLTSAAKHCDPFQLQSVSPGGVFLQHSMQTFATTSLNYLTGRSEHTRRDHLDHSLYLHGTRDFCEDYPSERQPAFKKCMGRVIFPMSQGQPHRTFASPYTVSSITVRDSFLHPPPPKKKLAYSPLHHSLDSCYPASALTGLSLVRTRGFDPRSSHPVSIFDGFPKSLQTNNGMALSLDGLRTQESRPLVYLDDAITLVVVRVQPDSEVGIEQRRNVREKEKGDPREKPAEQRHRLARISRAETGVTER